MRHKYSESEYKLYVKSENTKITQAAGVIALATLFSRITGYIRDMIFASFFGMGMVSDAFIAAFRIPNLLRRLLGEGSLSLAFIPVFAQYLARGDSSLAYELAARALKFLFFFLILISSIGIILMPSILNFITPGFLESPQKMELTIKLARIMFPYVFFAGMLALCMSILNVLDHFAAPAFAPVLLNLSMIGFLYGSNFFQYQQESLIIWLSWGVLVGGTLQLVLQVPVLLKKEIPFLRNFNIWHPGFKKIAIVMLPTVFGSAAYQVNVAVGTLFASFLAEGSVSCLYYADRIVQFPLGVFAFAFATAVLPSLARRISEKKYDIVGETFAFVIKFLMFITIPASAGLIVLREPIVKLLFGRGAFGSDALLLTSEALLYYSIGLCSFSTVKILNSVFFSLRDTTAPVIVTTFSIIFNICLSFMLLKSLGHSGIALATSIASMVSTTSLLCVLHRKIRNIPWRNIGLSIAKTFICTLFMVFGIYKIRQIFIPSMGEFSGVSLLFALFLCLAVGIFIFFFTAFVFRMSQFKQVLFMIYKSDKS